MREVSVSELMSMREQGMSNRDIASALDITYQTVLKYIGKQPPTSVMQRQPAAVLPVSGEETLNVVPDQEVHPDQQSSALRVVSAVYTLKGAAALYTFDTSEDEVVVSIDDEQDTQQHFEIPYNKLHALMDDLKEMMSRLPVQQPLVLGR